MAIFTIALFALAACESEKSENDTVNDVSVEVLPEPELGHKSQDPVLGGAMVTPGSPFRVTYTIIGAPVVGSPVTVDLRIESVTLIHLPVGCCPASFAGHSLNHPALHHAHEHALHSVLGGY